MKKQKFEKRLSLKARKVSNLTTQQAIIGGGSFTCNPCIISDVNTCQITEEPIKITQAIRCGHTIGNGQNPDGTPCNF
ncbi:MAG: hypothetical protein AB8B65_05070 [Kordia sp.]|uniref:hypothetical protein n=1 Tax=Kordia sp. TaxID=1965332 RepID=UPI003858A094